MIEDKKKSGQEINNIDEFHSWALGMQKRVQEFGYDFDQVGELKEVIKECLKTKTFDEKLLQEKYDFVQNANNKRLDRQIDLLIPSSKVFFEKIDSLERRLKFQYPINPAECFIEECEKALNNLIEVPDTDQSFIFLTDQLQLSKEALAGKGYFPVWRHLYNFNLHYKENEGRMYAVSLDSKNKEFIEQRRVDAGYSKTQGHETTIQNLIIKYIDEGRAYPMKTLITDIEELELKDHKGELVTFGKTALEKYIKQYKKTGNITE